MFEILASLFYFPTILVNMIGLLFSFVFMLNMSSFSLITATENFVFNRYSAITRRIHLPKHRTPRQFTPSISFMGGGQLWMFAIGVGHYVYENFDINCIKFLASSSGTFAAVPLACGLDPYDWCRKDWAKCMEHFETRGALGCLYDTKHFYYNLWNEYLPEDAHIRCSGRLFISVTLFPSMKNRVVSQFHSRDELIWTIVGSICLPFVFIRDFPVKCSDEIGYVMDGGFSNDSPCLDSYTITVSALHRKADIKPVMSANPDGSYYGHNHHAHHSNHSNHHHDGHLAHTHSGSVEEGARVAGGNQAQAGPLLSPWKMRCGHQVTPADFDNPMTSAEEEHLAADDAENSGSDSDSDDSESDTDTSGGNLLVESNEPDPPATPSCRDPRDPPSGASGEVEVSVAMAAAYKESIRIRPIDIIRVPKYERVWQIGSMGQDSAAKCLDFERHEWVSIRKIKA